LEKGATIEEAKGFPPVVSQFVSVVPLEEHLLLVALTISEDALDK
jgi:hypothetical protein